MYLPSSAPLPPNNKMPPPPWQTACRARQVARLDQSAQYALNAVRCVAAPASFASFSAYLPAVVAKGLNSISPLNPPNNAEVAATASVTQSDIATAPRARPMNDMSWGRGCTGTVGAAPQPQVLTGSASVLASKVSPAPAMRAPTWTNLCWALRNGMVDASQFEPAELVKLQSACSQLGYVGSCPTPPAVRAYMDANRGSLPHIPVSDADLKMIPRASNVQGMSCAASYVLGGLAGVPWGNAGRQKCGSGPGMSDLAAMMKSSPVTALLVAAAVGFVVQWALER